MPASPSSNLPMRRAEAPVKAPRSWPKSSLSSSVSGIAAQLIATNGAVAPRRERVDRAREELLAGAALALEQDGRVGRRDALGLGAHGADRGGLAHDRRHRARLRLGEEQRLRASAPAARSRARRSRRSRSGSTGLVMKSSAPCFIASTAVSIEPKAVMTSTGSVGSTAIAASRTASAVGAGQPPVGQDEVRRALPRAAARRPGRRCRRRRPGGPRP